MLQLSGQSQLMVAFPSFSEYTRSSAVARWNCDNFEIANDLCFFAKRKKVKTKQMQRSSGLDRWPKVRHEYLGA